MTSKGLAIIGAGLWGETHAKAYQQCARSELIAVCDIVEDRAKAFAEKFDVAAWHTAPAAILSDDRVAAVSITTPDFSHRDLCVAAAEAGKHILVEKPFATCVEDCETMIDAAKKAGVILMVDFHNRWNPQFAQAKEAIVNGEIGTPCHGYFRHSNTRYVPREMLSWSGKSSVLWFLGSHSCDLARWTFGDEVAKVYCVSRANVLKAEGIDTPDFFETILEFRGGGVAVVENSWLLPDTMPTLGDFKAQIIGSKGAIFADFSTCRALEKYTADDARFMDVWAGPTVHDKMRGFVLDSIYHFVDCVCDGTEPLATGEDGLANTRILCAALESIEEGMPVELE